VTNTKDALARARGEAQDLHRKIEASTAKNHAVIRTDVQNAALQAQALAASLKTVAEAQRTDAKQHLKDAASQLEAAGKVARDVAGASEAQLKQTNRAMLGKVRASLENLSQAVASQRSSAKAKA